MIKNYHLFAKYLQKISPATIARFGSSDNLIKFLQELCSSGNIALAARKCTSLSPLYLHRIINNDKYLARCFTIALHIAVETAEGVLYDRAINGYEELTYNRTGECIARKKKYCSRSLLEYLKANSVKYQPKKTESKQDKHRKDMINISRFEVESYGAEEQENTDI